MDAIDAVEKEVVNSSLMSDAALLCLRRMTFYNYLENEPRTWRLPATNYWADAEVNTVEVEFVDDDQVPAINDLEDAESDQNDNDDSGITNESTNEGSSTIID